MSVQAIAGVSASSEARIMTEFPSVGATAIGRLMGQLLRSIPVRISGIPLSTLLFGLPLAPLGALVFLLMKALGSRYVLTNRSVQIWSALGDQRRQSVSLSEIADVQLEQTSGQDFYRASDIRLKAANGQTLMLLSGISDAGSFATAIRRAVKARNLVQQSLQTIAARAN
ncbi:MAG: PH domain-containing protein [Planctomycetaceae bacterium]|nr:PH domain-containing protein [Planctomycetaceae bacterium]